MDVFNVGSMTAAVVEVGGLWLKEPGFHGETDGFGGGDSCDRSLMPLDFGEVSGWLVVGSWGGLDRLAFFRCHL